MRLCYISRKEGTFGVWFLILVLVGIWKVDSLNGQVENSSFLKLVSDRNMYDEWLKTMNATEELILERYWILLDMIDLNKDRNLDEMELKKWVKFVSERSTLKELEAEFSMLDRDKDGKLSSDEFVHSFALDDSVLGRFYQELFSDADLNKDGYLDRSEYFKLTSEYSLSKELLRKINSFFVQNDRNGDGIIDKQEMRQIQTENMEIVSVQLNKMTIFGLDVSDQDNLTVKKVIFLLRSNELLEAVNDAYNQLMDVFRTRKDAQPGDSDSTSIPLEFVKSNYVIFIQSVLTDYGDVFKYPHDFFVGIDEKEYLLSSEECSRLFGENEKISGDAGVDENDFENDEFDTDEGNTDDVEISDDMIQRLISLMSSSGMGDVDDAGGSMFDVFANKAGGEGDIAGMEEILKMLQSLVGPRSGQVGEDFGGPEAFLDALDNDQEHDQEDGEDLNMGSKDEL